MICGGDQVGILTKTKKAVKDYVKSLAEQRKRQQEFNAKIRKAEHHAFQREMIRQAKHRGRIKARRAAKSNRDPFHDGIPKLKMPDLWGDMPPTITKKSKEQ
jgi:hypothetical protein